MSLGHCTSLAFYIQNIAALSFRPDGLALIDLTQLGRNTEIENLCSTMYLELLKYAG